MHLSSRMLQTQADERLAVAAAQGHERAFEALVLRYRRPLLGYSRRLGLREARAEEVVQQSLMRAWVSLQRGAAVRDVSAWLYRIVHNAAVDALRGSVEAHEQLGDLAGEIAASRGDPECATTLRETLASVAALPDMQREALLCTAVEGRSNEQAARALGVSDGAVRGLVYRARATLRAAASAVIPPPLFGWALAAGRSGSGIADRPAITEAGGASAGLAAGALIKGGALILAAGAIAGGIVAVRHPPREPVVHSDASVLAGAVAPSRVSDAGGAPGLSKASRLGIARASRGARSGMLAQRRLPARALASLTAASRPPVVSGGQSAAPSSDAGGGTAAAGAPAQESVVGVSSASPAGTTRRRPPGPGGVSSVASGGGRSSGTGGTPSATTTVVPLSSGGGGTGHPLEGPGPEGSSGHEAPSGGGSSKGPESGESPKVSAPSSSVVPKP